MDYEKELEQKAQRYDEAIRKAKITLDCCDSASITTKNTVYGIFPELKESEDERVRKWLIKYFNKADFNGMLEYVNGIKSEDILAWLEKQFNQREQLINKACDVLVNCIEDYMLRRMEVWNEESKKQTLENIRKTLEE